MSLITQFQTIGAMVGGGALMGVLFDVFRIVAVQLRFPRWLYAFLDIIYWILATIFIFRLLFLYNFGEVRLYVFLGLILGGWLYFLLFSKYTVRLVQILIKGVHAIIVFLIKLGNVLIIRPLMGLYKCFILLMGFLLAMTIFLYKVMLQLTYPFQRILIWLIQFMGLHSLWTKLKGFWNHMMKRWKR